MIIRCDWHVHSRYSFDCFSSIKDIIKQAKKKGINVLAITDHDVIKLTKREGELFLQAKIHYLVGSEFTSTRGAHIIGLFNRDNPMNDIVNKHPCDIVDYICRLGGKVIIPHAYKPETGFISLYADDKKILDYVLLKTAAIELYNGDYDLENYQDKIKRIAQEYNIHLVSASDAHKPWHIGDFYTDYETNNVLSENILEILNTRPIGLGYPTSGNKRLNVYQWAIRQRGKIPFYKFLIKITPFFIKRNIKRIFYLNERLFRNK